jgi:hypothetical protein
MVAHVDHRGILTHSRANDDSGIGLGIGGKQTLQEVRGELARFEHSHQVDSPHLRDAG